VIGFVWCTSTTTLAQAAGQGNSIKPVIIIIIICIAPNIKSETTNVAIGPIKNEMQWEQVTANKTH